jgi:hypothetical protein
VDPSLLDDDQCFDDDADGPSNKTAMEGWLKKKSPKSIMGKKAWQRRWFVLDAKAAKITYYEKQGCADKGVIFFTQVKEGTVVVNILLPLLLLLLLGSFSSGILLLRDPSPLGSFSSRIPFLWDPHPVGSSSGSSGILLLLLLLVLLKLLLFLICSSFSSSSLLLPLLLLLSSSSFSTSIVQLPHHLLIITTTS